MEESKIIVSSAALLIKIAYLEDMDFCSIRIQGIKETNSLILGSIKILDCEMSKSFVGTIFKNKVQKLIAHLKLLSDQPIVIGFDDSEVFNIFIRQFYI